MVMAVSSGIDTTVPEATPAEEEEEVAVAAAVVEEEPEEEVPVPVQEEEQEEEEEQAQGNEQGKAEEPEESHEEHIIRVQEEVQEEEEEQVPLVVTVESWLSGNRLEKFLDALRELGVENVADLKDVLDEDLESIGMKKLEIRRYLAATESL